MKKAEDKSIEQIYERMSLKELTGTVGLRLGFGEVCTLLSAHRALYLEESKPKDPEIDFLSIKVVGAVIALNNLTDQQYELLEACSGIPIAALKEVKRAPETLREVPENA